MKNVSSMTERLAAMVFCLAMMTGWCNVSAAVADSLPVAFGTRLGGDNAKTRFVAELDQAVGYDVYVIADPFRVILDLPQVDFRLSQDTGTRGRGLISGYRFGRIDDTRSRIVLDATGPVLIDRSFALRPRDGQPARLVVDVVRTDRPTFDAYRLREQPQPPPAPEAPIEAIDRGKTRLAAADNPDLTALPAPGPEQIALDEARIAELLKDIEPVPLPRSRPAEIAGLAPPVVERRAPTLVSSPVIVLDPGHGGIDPGAISRRTKTREKDIVLKFAFELREHLSKSGKFKVLMTRTDDSFISLPDRVRFARDAGAHLFVAIHADSIRHRRARGATVYTVSEKASDEEAEELAHKENRSDIIAGIDLAKENDEITGILIDLAQRETKNFSISAAKGMVKQLKPVTRLNSRPLRSAGFRVLMAPDVPSVLLELGYLSNRYDEKLLASKAWRKKVSAAVAKAVDGYFVTRLAAGNDR